MEDRFGAKTFYPHSTEGSVTTVLTHAIMQVPGGRGEQDVTGTAFRRSSTELLVRDEAPDSSGSMKTIVKLAVF